MVELICGSLSATTRPLLLGKVGLVVGMWDLPLDGAVLGRQIVCRRNGPSLEVGESVGRDRRRLVKNENDVCWSREAVATCVTLRTRNTNKTLVTLGACKGPVERKYSAVMDNAVTSKRARSYANTPGEPAPPEGPVSPTSPFKPGAPAPAVDPNSPRLPWSPLAPFVPSEPGVPGVPSRPGSPAPPVNVKM